MVFSGFPEKKIWKTLIWIIGLKVFSLQKRSVVDFIFRLWHFL